MDVIEAIYHRGSVRAFTADMVPSEVIDDLISAAVQAPSAMNLQPWAFWIPRAAPPCRNSPRAPSGIFSK